jgi:hypothetical protein
MNQATLRQRASELESLLRHYAALDAEVAQLLSALTPLLSAVIDGKAQTPMEWRDVPGDFYFNERGLRKYRDVEDAYAKFKIELTGGESPTLRALREKMNSGKS